MTAHWSPRIQFLQRVWPHHSTYGTFSTMLKNSQQIGHSSPTSSLAHGEVSSSEQSGWVAWLDFIRLLLGPKLPAMAREPQLHILTAMEAASSEWLLFGSWTTKDGILQGQVWINKQILAYILMILSISLTILLSSCNSLKSCVTYKGQDSSIFIENDELRRERWQLVSSTNLKLRTKRKMPHLIHYQRIHSSVGPIIINKIDPVNGSKDENQMLIFVKRGLKIMGKYHSVQ